MGDEEHGPIAISTDGCEIEVTLISRGIVASKIRLPGGEEVCVYNSSLPGNAVEGSKLTLRTLAQLRRSRLLWMVFWIIALLLFALLYFILG